MSFHERLWYGDHPVRFLLLPFSLLFGLVVALRRVAYRTGLLSTRRFPVPVLVIGNISVGGTGKTPLTIWLAEHLVQKGWRPGIVARGYGGKATVWPQKVRPDGDPTSVGDEAVLLARRTGCPVCVGPDRVAAVEAVLQHTDCNLIISDDGLQHYRLGRDLEIVVIDGGRRFGNGLLLPAGPLREPRSRLEQVDMVVCNGQAGEGEYGFSLSGIELLPLATGTSADPDVVRPLADMSGQMVHAVAGVGNAQRFFRLLEQNGLQVIEHAFPDHHRFNADDIQFEDSLPVLMTEKDAVKCERFPCDRHWFVRIQVAPQPEFVDTFDRLLTGTENGQQAA